MNVPGLFYGLLHCTGRFKSEMLYELRASGARNEHPRCMAKSLQGVGGHDAVHGMKAVAEPVLVDVVGPVGKVVLKDVSYLIRIPVIRQDLLPYFPVRGMVNMVPFVRAGADHDNRAPGFAHLSGV
jgi:hypothetical protein